MSPSTLVASTSTELHPYKWPRDYSTGTSILLCGAKTQLLSVTLSRPSKPIPCGSLTYITEFGCGLEMQHRPPLDHSVCVLTLKKCVPDFTSVMLLSLITAHLTGPANQPHVSQGNKGFTPAVSR